MANEISFAGHEALLKQVHALGSDVKKDANAALKEGAQIIAAEAKIRAPRSEKAKPHLGDALIADAVSSRSIAGVTVKGGFRGSFYYIKFVEYGTTKMTARRFIHDSAVAKEAQVVDSVVRVLKSRMGL